MSAAHAGGESQRDFQIFDIVRVDLVKRAVARAGVILRRHSPLAVIGLVLNLPENRYGDQDPDQQV